jgi:hypothetical protein
MFRSILYLILFLSIISYEGYSKYEGYISYNENLNKDNKFPDNTQFFFVNKNEYIKQHNSIKEPQGGVYSGFLDANNLRSYDHFFHSPISQRNKSNNLSYDKLFDYEIIQQEDPNKYELLENEKLNDRFINDPYFTHGSYENNSPILYSEDIQKLMLKYKRKTNRYENVSHTGPGYHPENTE